ncbi:MULTISPECIES: DUF4179 domain-containing protein [Clostridium]|uniref:DUF4179 domain-containing protein n=1 Tax=Clostridium saccharoperbutylacetonicum N1-4(HMT) TaxID=931276 RepID=M1MYY8_9CLOT|nr:MULTISPECIES: DUF4179 domain-containing protein [Clostridium]AGF56617.1 hypothetical protein DUF4179 [Clostridium saccharoperbutylacetonicum N1-4(HMT)]AQR95291.1 hypothetical protein CLSAP_26070 [Clostridium saccharoperbutylacetonicum]NRT62632.1 hypothetical protein [Clostridium saccharoperbutylacetonicum]NSB25979.1 hypothetical protein [Clostridium saccharoperbutylacetonicum]NSB31146.1 hypothetical protein [Clostridium saccharoperbutylacetonicum]
MINKKLSKTLGPILGIMGFMLAIGVMESPVFADTSTTSQISNVTTQAAVTSTQNNDYYININKVVTQNGIKVTLDKALASKHNIKAIIKIESDKPFDKSSYSDSIYELTYDNDFDCRSDNVSKKYIDDKTMIITLEKDNYKNEYSPKGNIRVDVALSKYKVNIGIESPVDFTDSFKNVFEKKISGKIPGFNYTLNSIEADVIGTKINYTEPKWDEAKSSNEDSIWNSIMLLKLGDKYYKIDSNGNYSGSSDTLMGNYKTNLATYDLVKDEKNISIIPLISYMTTDDFKDVDKNSHDLDSTTTKDKKNNVNYPKDYKFSDETKGEIYKIERTNGLLKVYLKGSSEKESLLMANSMFIHYTYAKDEKNHTYINNNDIVLYKDSNEALGYIVEIKDPEKDRELNINLDDSIRLIDKYKLENEIKLTD